MRAWKPQQTKRSAKYLNKSPSMAKKYKRVTDEDVNMKYIVSAE